MAGQDIKENEMQQVAVAALLRCLDASGNSKVITPAYLLSLVMNHRGVVDYSNPDEINNTKATGMYNHWGGLSGTISTHGILVVFNADSYIVQIDLSFDFKILMRQSTNRGESWTGWKSITLT